jgi:hypothetical protein
VEDAREHVAEGRSLEEAGIPGCLGGEFWNHGEDQVLRKEYSLEMDG